MRKRARYERFSTHAPARATTPILRAPRRTRGDRETWLPPTESRGFRFHVFLLHPLFCAYKWPVRDYENSLSLHFSALAQLVERKTFNLVAAGSSPVRGRAFCMPTSGLQSGAALEPVRSAASAARRRLHGKTDLLDLHATKQIDSCRVCACECESATVHSGLGLRLGLQTEVTRFAICVPHALLRLSCPSNTISARLSGMWCWWPPRSLSLLNVNVS